MRSADGVCFAAVVALLLAGLAGCRSSGPAVVELPPPDVTVAQPIVDRVTDYFEFTGNTAASKEVEVRARISGYLRKINFVDGAAVKENEVLFEIDDRDFVNAVKRAEAQVEVQKAALQKAQADLARFERLRATGNASQEEIDQAVAAQNSADAAIEAANAVVDQAKLDLEYTKVLSAPTRAANTCWSSTARRTSPIGGRFASGPSTRDFARSRRSRGSSRAGWPPANGS